MSGTSVVFHGSRDQLAKLDAAESALREHRPDKLKYDLICRPGATDRRVMHLSRRLGLADIAAVGRKLVPKLRGGGTEDGWNAEDIHRYEREGGVLMAAMSGLLEAQKAVTIEVEQLGEFSEAYMKAVRKIRGELVNDVDSVAKATARLKTETTKSIELHQSTIDLWNSPQMEAAIHNAERLAKALESISAVQQNNITFAVLSKNGGTNG